MHDIGLCYYMTWDEFHKWFNSSPPGQNGHHCGWRHFQTHFLDKNVRTAIKITMKFVPKGPLDNESALVQVMAWHRTGDNPLPEPMLTQFTDPYMRHSGEMSEWVIKFNGLSGDSGHRGPYSPYKPCNQGRWVKRYNPHLTKAHFSHGWNDDSIRS